MVVSFLAWVGGFIFAVRFVERGGPSFQILLPVPVGPYPQGRVPMHWRAIDTYRLFGVVEVEKHASQDRVDSDGSPFRGLPPWSQLLRERSELLIHSDFNRAREIAIGWPMRVVVFEYWGNIIYYQSNDCRITTLTPAVHTRLWWPGIFGTLACLGVAALIGWLVGVVVFTVRNRVDRARLRADLCPRCRYPRPEHANDAGSVCPECGWVYKAREMEIGYGE